MGIFDTMKTKSLKTSPFHTAVICAVLVSVILLFIDPALALIPGVCLMFICAAAPFLLRTGFFLPVISRGCLSDNAVALTFDDGPDPFVTPLLLRILSKHSARACFFVIGEKAEMHSEIITEIISGSHLVASHSYRHDPLLMLRSASVLRKDIEASVSTLKKYNIRPLAFRPPAGITNPRLAKVLSDLGLQCVNFSCRAFDAGNRNFAGLSEKILSKVKSNDIILLHDVFPRNKDVSAWLDEIELLLAGLKERGFRIARLDELTGEPVMELIDPGK